MEPSSRTRTTSQPDLVGPVDATLAKPWDSAQFDHWSETTDAAVMAYRDRGEWPTDSSDADDL
ncbi:MAG TPA: hypothetical protein VH328_07500, partial [Burkholderiaceae bacterium]|nr:hypothetical protein [Burkholderiaceae bacterium]